MANGDFELRGYYQAELGDDDPFALDIVAAEAVGKESEWSGCGCGCDNAGNRDLGWTFDTFNAAVAAKDRLLSAGPFKARVQERTSYEGEESPNAQ